MIERVSVFQMRLSFPLSLIGHAGLLGLSMVAFSEAKRFDAVPVVAISIESIPVEDFQTLTQGNLDADAVQQDTSSAPAEESNTATQESNNQIDTPSTAPDLADKIDDTPQPDDLIEAPPLPEIRPDVAPEPIAETKPEPKVEPSLPKPVDPPKPDVVEPTPTAEPEKQVEEQQLEFAGLTLPKRAPARPKPAKVKTAPKKADELGSLINREAQRAAPKKQGQNAEKQQASLGTKTGSAVKLTASDKDSFIAQVQRCWRPPVFLQDSALTVDILVDLNADGTLRQRPRAVNTNGHPEFTAMSGSAIRALERCQPYKLRAGTFEAWQRGLDITFRVDDIL